MGDEELNFTDEEARCWADDPRNQPEDWGTFERLFGVVAALVMAVLIAMCLVSMAVQQAPATGQAIPAL